MLCTPISQLVLYTRNNITMDDFQSLNFSQVSKLNTVLSSELEIHSHNNFPSLSITPAGLVQVVKSNLLKTGIALGDIRMNGSAASYCICDDSDNHPKIHYNDIDLIFGVTIKDDSEFHVIKDVVMTSLMDFLPELVSRDNISCQLMEETYIRKMVRVSNQSSCWSLISLGEGSTTIELKFVHKIRRKYQFTVDSFQILIDSYFDFNKCTEESPVSMSQIFFPSVQAISVYHDYKEALRHLNNRQIHTEAPEEIRGGGLLKYCSLLVNGFKPADEDEMAHLEPYMCSRFFIDFPNKEVQYEIIEKYVTSRFVERGEGTGKGIEFLDLLYSVVSSRAKCLVESERQKTMSVLMYIKSMFVPQLLEYSRPFPFHVQISNGSFHQQHQGYHHHHQQQQQLCSATYFHSSSSSFNSRRSHYYRTHSHRMRQHPHWNYIGQSQPTSAVR